MGCFGKPGENPPSHVLLANLDYKQAVPTPLIRPEPINVFHTPNQSQISDDGDARVKLKLLPSSGMLFCLTDNGPAPTHKEWSLEIENHD